jgi:hypothetical protein
MEGLACCGGKSGTAVSSSLIRHVLSLREDVRGAGIVCRRGGVREGRRGCEHLQRGNLRDGVKRSRRGALKPVRRIEVCAGIAGRVDERVKLRPPLAHAIRCSWRRNELEL